MVGVQGDMAGLGNQVDARWDELVLIVGLVPGADVANMNVLISREQVKPLLNGFKAKHRRDIDIMHMQPRMYCLSKMSDQE